jgi:hypothetical protein
VEGLLFLVVAGLIGAWRYEVFGGALALVASFGFFVAGYGPAWWVFFPVTALPSLAFISCGTLAARLRRTANLHG